MLRLSLLSLFFLLFPCVLFAQEITLHDRWGSNTAYLMTAGKWETGIFQPFRFGLSEKMEIRSNAIIMPVLPNAGIKISLGTSKDFVFASEHSLSYTTPFLNLVSFKGTGGLISPQYSFSFILSLSNSLVVSKPVGKASLLSVDAGFTFAIRDSKPDYQATIDLPLFYPRMAHYYDGSSVRASISFKGTITNKLFYEDKVRMYLITRNSDNLFVENTGIIMWAAGRSLRLQGGYVLSWGRYPFGNHFQLWPTFDIVFGSRY